MKRLVLNCLVGILGLGLIVSESAFCANQMTPDVYSFTIFQDSTAPAAISNLAVSQSTDTSLTLTWTAPGDDNSSGTAANYDLRYSTASINAGNWASAVRVSGEPSPSQAGTTEIITITGLNASTTYYFAIKTADEVPNTSSLSNNANATTDNPPDTVAPYTTGHSPAKSATSVSEDSDIVVHVKDDGTGVDINSIIMKVNGTQVSPVISGTSDDYILTYTPPAPFGLGQIINVTLEAADLAL